MVRRRFVVFIIVVAITFSMATCSRQDSIVENRSDECLSILHDASFRYIVQDIADLYCFSYGDLKFEFTELSQSPEERVIQLSRIRTEVAAGDGPDIYLLDCPSPVNARIGLEPLFQDIEEAAANNVFFPLNGYLGQCRYFEYDNQAPIIIEAGKFDGMQVILPLSYSYSMFVADKERMVEPNRSYNSINELLNSEDEQLSQQIISNIIYWDRLYLGRLFDYDSFSVGIEKKQLIETFQFEELYHKESNKDSSSLENPILNSEYTYLSKAAVEDIVKNSDKYVPIPIPNIDNGITAYISSFVAVDRNTENPEAAIRYIDLLYSEECLLGKPYDDEQFSRSLVSAIGNRNGMICDYRCFESKLYADDCLLLLNNLNQKISSVIYPGSADVYLSSQLSSYRIYYSKDDEDLLYEVVDDTIKTLQMMLVE